MLLYEFLQQIFFDMRAHKLRSLLALFGIVWGTVAVVVLLSLGQGFYNKQIRNLASLASGTMEVYFGRTSKPYQGLPLGRELFIKAQEVVNLPKLLPEITQASPNLIHQGIIIYGSGQNQAAISGVSTDYINIRHWEVNPGGRFFNNFDSKELRRVVFLGAKLKKTLFHDHEALGRQVLLNGMPFTVIGVREDKNQAESWEDYNAFIPYGTFIALWGNQNLGQFVFTIANPEQTEPAKQALTHYFASRYQFDPTDKSVLNIMDYSSIRTFFVWFFRIIQWFLGLCGAFTLGVGGIGIANTLYLIVQERTQEIGLRKALGAQKHHILGQFLLETLILVGAGGIIGMLLAFSTIKILAMMPLPDWLGIPVVSYPILITACLILVVLGMLAGYFPARRAASMQPVKALAAPPC